jgi:hypothetical protein
MANDVVDFQSRRAAREVERAEYDARHKRVVAIFKMLAPVIARAQELVNFMRIPPLPILLGGLYHS